MESIFYFSEIIPITKKYGYDNIGINTCTPDYIKHVEKKL